MYVMNEILDFFPGRRDDGLARLAWIHSLMVKQPGFQRAFVAKYLGDATRYTIMRFWDDEAAFTTFRAGPDGNYGQNRPAGLYTNAPVVPRWNSYDEVSGGASGKYLVKVQTHVAPEAHGLFLEHQKHVNDWVRPIAGLVSMSQSRSPEGDDFLNVLRFAAASDFPLIFDNPDRVKERSAMPDSVSPSDITCFEIVTEVLP